MRIWLRETLRDLSDRLDPPRRDQALPAAPPPDPVPFPIFLPGLASAAAPPLPPSWREGTPFPRPLAPSAPPPIAILQRLSGPTPRPSPPPPTSSYTPFP